MTKVLTPAASAKATLLTARRFNRRLVLKAGAAAGAVAVTGPFFVRGALAAGEVNILMWSDYLPESFTKAFEEKTGIKINFTGIGSNEEIINKLKATQGEGFDICSPTADRAPQWAELDLLQPVDLKKVPIANVNPAMAKIGEQNWNFGNKGTHWLPHMWGTEGVAWRTDQWNPKDEFPSYGDVWSDENAGKTMGRPHSMMLGAGLYMETTGELEPGSIWAAYTAQDKMRATWEKVTAWCVSKKKNIKMFWNDADAQKNGLLNEGVVCGQTWDGPPLALKTAGEPVMYRAPKEGAMAWVDGLAIPKGAKNIDNAYAFIDFAFQAEPAGKAIDTHGYNTPVIGAEKFANEKYAKNFGDAYPGDALAKLNPWPPTQPWYADIRTEYVNKFQSA
ncbi:MAG: extracellular solute-binding protein [Parvibaculaceae bacterium]